MGVELEKVADITDVTQSQADTLFKSVLKTSLITLSYLFLFSLLATTYFFMRFPYHTMNLYLDFSMPKTALAHCERAVNVLDSKTQSGIYTETLINGVELSNMLYVDTADIKYAQKLIKFSDTLASQENFDAISANINDFYYQQIQAGTSGISLYTAISLYSFKDFVYSSNQMARLAVGDTQNMLFNGQKTQINSITTEEICALNRYDLAVFFNQAVYINSEQITASILIASEDFLIFTQTVTNKIGQLYLLKSAQNIKSALIANAQQMQDATQKQERLNQINNAFTINNQPIDDYFLDKLNNY